MGLPLSMLAVLAVVHPHARGSGVDYIGVFLASAASWAALPGPGEAALIAAGISAAHGHLDLASVVAVAWAGASTGGTAGWIVGVKGGRELLTAAGPLHRLRLALIARGDRFYERYGLVAVLFTPSWIDGIHDMRWSRFLPANAISALTWALSVGLGPPAPHRPPARRARLSAGLLGSKGGQPPHLGLPPVARPMVNPVKACAGARYANGRGAVPYCCGEPPVWGLGIGSVGGQWLG